MFTELFNAIFVKSFDTFSRDLDDYLTFIILPYLERLHHFGIRVSTFVQQNSFGNIKSIICSHPKPYKMLY
jgi:hypothetical protein